MFIIYFSISGYKKSMLDSVAMSANLTKDFHSIEELADYLKTHYVKSILYPEYDIDKIAVNVIEIVKHPADGGKSEVVWLNAKELI